MVVSTHGGRNILREQNTVIFLHLKGEVNIYTASLSTAGLGLEDGLELNLGKQSINVN